MTQRSCPGWVVCGLCCHLKGRPLTHTSTHSNYVVVRIFSEKLAPPVPADGADAEKFNGWENMGMRVFFAPMPCFSSHVRHTYTATSPGGSCYGEKRMEIKKRTTTAFVASAITRSIKSLRHRVETREEIFKYTRGRVFFNESGACTLGL